MSIRIVYVTTVGGDAEIFGRMAALSARSLRFVEPDAEIVVLTDGPVGAALESFFPAGVEFVPVDSIPYADPVARSRYIKTSVAEYVAAPFLFIDSDTLVVRPFLQKLSRSKYEMMASYNRHRGFPATTPWASWTRGIFDLEKEPFPPRKHYNSGVIFCKDKHAAAAFYEKWHSVWRRQWEQLGVARDQPCFNLSIAAVSLRFGSLPMTYNACLAASPSFARRAAVWHFTGAGKGANGRGNTLLGRLLKAVGTEPSETDTLLAEEMAKAKHQFDARNFVSNPQDYGPVHYVEGVKKALRVRDYEAFSYLFGEICRTAPFSRGMVKLIAKGIPKATLAGLLRRT